MEHRYRVIDERRRSALTPPTPTSNYTEQLRPAGHSIGPGFGRSYEYNQDMTERRETILIELEKEKIREEIIAQEIARIRRGLMIQRELAMERGVDGFYFPSSLTTFKPNEQPAPPLVHGADGRSVEARNALSLEERIGKSAMLRRFGHFDSTTF